MGIGKDGLDPRPQLKVKFLRSYSIIENSPNLMSKNSQQVL